ncbi:Transmembrane protein 62 [Rhynchospora pubera]|uniref:Transmembrane protein 62 n=1 Tax=Rhynchospora pubera TaxID=906938 RepID=A0AAV8HQB6_9POAL|nr:Transmembrane protein 62 [Rhynchospora pubera]
MSSKSLSSRFFSSVLFLTFALSSPFLLKPGEAEHATVSRETFHLDDDVAWVLQVSDLHISRYYPHRSADLATLLASAVGVIRPALLLITGDITDAKTKDKTSSRQYESEWIAYRNAMNEVVMQSGIEKARIFDIRGNHDTYGVPYVSHELDYFSKYSINAELNRTADIYSISLLTNDTRYLFLGIDDSMQIGIRRPTNLFGHPTDKTVQLINSDIQFDGNYNSAATTKIGFGHFPLSFTASTPNGETYQNVFANNSFSTYICGHLHAKMSSKLRWLHKLTVDGNEGKRALRSFWEWELGDWKDNGFARILSIDKGAVSFMDFRLSKTKSGFDTRILITYPTDSRSMNQAARGGSLIRNDINALIFSSRSVLNVTARVFDSARGFRIVEEIPLRPKSGHDIQQYQYPLFHSKWNAESYKSDNPTRYWVQIFVRDSDEKEVSSERRPFSAEGRGAIQSFHLLNYILLGVRWEDLYNIMLWSNLGFLTLCLSLPKVMHHFARRSVTYRNWYHPLVSYLIEGSRNRAIWFSLVIYLFWLMYMPWLWGYAMSQNGEIAPMYLSGWRIRDGNSLMEHGGIGKVDCMVITLPFLYCVVAPMLLLVYGLFAQQGRACLCKTETCSICARKWRRKTLLVASALVCLVHFKMCSNLMLAYGFGPVFLSPALSWAPLLIFAVSIYNTMKL